MSLFGNLKSDGLEEAQDRLGGFSRLETDAYKGVIKVAYAGKSPGGAQNVTLVVSIDGKDYNETIYVTNKKGENWFLNKDDNSKKVPLPGFTTLNNICLVTTGAELADQPTEDKIVNVYDPDQKKEMPKSVPVLVDLLGKEVILGIVKQLEDKSEKQGDKYVPITGPGRETNFIDVVAEAESRATVYEAQKATKNQTALEATFLDAWVAKNKGVTRDRREHIGEATQSGKPGRQNNSSAPVQGQQTERKSLFGQKAA